MTDMDMTGVVPLGPFYGEPESDPTPNPPLLARIRPLPSQERLLQMFEYNESQGLLFWRERRSNRIDLAEPAGTVDSRGYRLVSIDNKRYKHHRLVWAYFHGDPGAVLVDHINYTPGDDRIENLRLATMSQNKCNSPLPATNTSGHKGVSFYRPTGRWVAQIKKHGAKQHIGYFRTPEEAAAAYKIAAGRLHGDYAFEANTDTKEDAKS